MPETKTCSVYQLPLPIDQFRRRSRIGGLASNCRKCHRNEMTLLRLRRRAKKATRLAGELNRAKDRQDVHRIANGAMRAFKGMPGFCRAWAEAVATARPGSLAASNLLVGALRLAELSQPDRKQDAQRLELLTDEQLEERVRDLEQQMLATARAELTYQITE